jgi:hypothetical protein
MLEQTEKPNRALHLRDSIRIMRCDTSLVRYGTPRREVLTRYTYRVRDSEYTQSHVRELCPMELPVHRTTHSTNEYECTDTKRDSRVRSHVPAVAQASASPAQRREVSPRTDRYKRGTVCVSVSRGC